MKLTNEEIDLLQKGLDSIERAEKTGNMMNDLMKAMMAKDDPEAQLKIESDMKDRVLKERPQYQRLEERVILLKAKLIQMKDKNEVKRVLA